MVRRLSLIGALVMTAAAAVAAAQAAARADDAARMLTKLVSIAERGEAPTAVAKPALRTSFTDREVNAYFQEHGPAFLPEGVADPQVVIEDAGRVHARAIVDLDAALKPQERSWLDPLAWVGGKVEVTAAGTLQAAAGRGQFALERATLGGVAIPNSLLQELVSYYSRSPESPTGFNLAEPFDLPARIREVHTRRGAATVVQ
jgi:hypothetical protein